jgi:acyl-CoA synthetase (AMP-forming)/AMP-acid ligase II
MVLPGRPPPTTFEYIEMIALREPQRVALVQDHQSWTYQALYSDLVRVLRVLHAMGMKRGDRVAVGTEGLQAGLLLLLAAEHLGAVTTSFLAEGDPDLDTLFGMVDWAFSDRPQPAAPNVRNVTLDAQFIARLQGVDLSDTSPIPRGPLALDEPQRISRTSGSSGRSKFMLLKRHAQEHWVRTGAENGAYRPESRLLVAGPLVMNAIFARSSACLRMGAAVLDLARTGLAGQDFTHVLALPALLQDILDSLPPGYAPRTRVEVQTMGGFASQQLRERAMRVFGGRVASRYGANEVTGVCDDLDANGVGILSPGVDVRILDEDGRDVPHGRLGMIAVRTPGMVDGYLHDDESTRNAFRGGWFVSGDWGALIAHRTLRLVGRHDDLLIVGGLKVPAKDIESQACELAQASDCAALSVNLAGGMISLGLALVLAAHADRAAARAKVERGLKLGVNTSARIIFLDALPRMGNGKVDRVALHRMFESPPAGAA